MFGCCKLEKNQLKIFKILISILFWIILIFLFFNFVYAAGIDPNYKYALGENIGWLNFNSSNGNVDVSDTKIIGYVWLENYGWINLSPTNSGVLNDGNGNLSGYAWGENLGWIDFSNVKINPNTGDFSGYVLILKDGGKINFDCLNCKVKTYWRKSVFPYSPLNPPPLYSGHEEKTSVYLSENLVKDTIEKVFSQLSEEKTTSLKTFEPKKEIEFGILPKFSSPTLTNSSLSLEIKNISNNLSINFSFTTEKTTGSIKTQVPNKSFNFFKISSYQSLRYILFSIVLIFIVILGFIVFKK